MIGVSKTFSKMQKYQQWLDYYKVSYTVLDFENDKDGFKAFEKCSGLMLTGGIDIYPEIYCDWDTPETKGKYEPKRDGFEMHLLDIAFEKKMPVLAICRGMQLVNVYFRGSLIFDLMEIRNVDHSKISREEDRYHGITIYRDTLLHEITGEESAIVSSSHHQAVDRLGEGLIINAKSDDGIVEGIEFSEKTGKSFLLGIQWHPERFKDYSQPTSEKILKRFLNETEIFENI